MFHFNVFLQANRTYNFKSITKKRISDLFYHLIWIHVKLYSLQIIYEKLIWHRVSVNSKRREIYLVGKSRKKDGATIFRFTVQNPIQNRVISVALGGNQNLHQMCYISVSRATIFFYRSKNTKNIFFYSKFYWSSIITAYLWLKRGMIFKMSGK